MARVGDRSDTSLQFSWIRVGVVAGLVSVGAYTVLVVGSGPEQLGFVVASVFSFALGIAAYGLYQFLTVDRAATMVVQTAVTATVVGAVVFLAMATIQLSLRADLNGTDPTTMEAVFDLVDRVQLGLDLVWDVFFAVGTGLFGFAAYSHPRLGRVIGGLGVLVAVALLVFNVAAFPTPPADSGSIDLGPVAGLWYLAVTILVIRSLGWAEQALSTGLAADGQSD